MVKVLYLHFFRENPYHIRLKDDLLKYGIKVLGTESVPGVGNLPDILHIHDPHSSILVNSEKIARIRMQVYLDNLDRIIETGSRIVLTLHDLVNHAGVHPKLDADITGSVLERSSKVVFHSESARSEALKMFPGSWDERSTIIPHPNYIGAFHNRFGTTGAGIRMNIRRASTTLLVFGAIRSNKGYNRILEAFHTYQPRKSMQLIIAGPYHVTSPYKIIGNYCDMDKRIVFRPGPVQNHNIPLLFATADYAVFPYKGVATSGALSLAMSLSKAVIAPKELAFEELLDEKGGILYSSDSSTGLMDSLRESEARRKDVDRMGRHNFTIAKEWHHERIAQMTRDVYTEVMENRI